MYKTTQDCKNNGNITGYVQDNDNNTRLYKIMVEYVQDNGNTTELRGAATQDHRRYSSTIKVYEYGNTKSYKITEISQAHGRSR